MRSIIKTNTALICPNCRQPFKITKKCTICGRYCCSNCSIETQCIDCFTIRSTKNEIDIYYYDKVTA